MGAGYTIRHVHESKVDQRLESIEKAVSTILKTVDISLSILLNSLQKHCWVLKSP